MSGTPRPSQMPVIDAEWAQLAVGQAFSRQRSFKFWLGSAEQPCARGRKQRDRDQRYDERQKTRALAGDRHGALGRDRGSQPRELALSIGWLWLSSGFRNLRDRGSSGGRRGSLRGRIGNRHADRGATPGAILFCTGRRRGSEKSRLALRAEILNSYACRLWNNIRRDAELAPAVRAALFSPRVAVGNNKLAAAVRAEKLNHHCCD